MHLILGELTYWGDPGGYPDSTCYVARGRFDDGEYISIEYSSAYEAFAAGYYVVLAASGFKGNGAIHATLDRVRLKYPDAYIKTSRVYLCCFH